MAGPVLAFHQLSFAPEGDDVVVGRRDIDSYGVFPPDGAALGACTASVTSLHAVCEEVAAGLPDAFDLDAR